MLGGLTMKRGNSLHFLPITKCLFCLLLLFMIPFQAAGEEKVSGGQEVLSIFYPLRETAVSTEIPGIVQKIYYDMGEDFKKGATLVSFDSFYYREDRNKAVATRDSLESILKAKKSLFEQKSLSQVEYAKAVADFEIAKANAMIAEKKLAACSIKAPYSGRVVKLLTRENEFMPEGQVVIAIMDPSVIRAKFHLPSDYFGYITIGQKLNVMVKEMNKKYEMKITHISPVLESNTSSFQVFAEIINTDLSIRGGMTGHIMIDSAKDE